MEARPDALGPDIPEGMLGFPRLNPGTRAPGMKRGRNLLVGHAEYCNSSHYFLRVLAWSRGATKPKQAPMIRDVDLQDT